VFIARAPAASGSDRLHLPSELVDGDHPFLEQDVRDRGRPALVIAQLVVVLRPKVFDPPPQFVDGHDRRVPPPEELAHDPDALLPRLRGMLFGVEGTGF
jgi:hypothetical protein